MIIISKIIISILLFILSWLRKRNAIPEEKFKQMIIVLSIMFASNVYSLDVSLLNLERVLDISGGIVILSVFVFIYATFEDEEKSEELQDYVLILVLQFLIITNYVWRFL